MSPLDPTQIKNLLNTIEKTKRMARQKFTENDLRANWDKRVLKKLKKEDFTKESQVKRFIRENMHKEPVSYYIFNKMMKEDDSFARTVNYLINESLSSERKAEGVVFTKLDERIKVLSEYELLSKKEIYERLEELRQYVLRQSLVDAHKLDWLGVWKLSAIISLLTNILLLAIILW